MKANELRIGNFYDHYGEIKKITPNDIVELWESERPWIKPIPLTEEWLLKFGFILEESTGNYWFNLQDHYIELIKIKDKYYPVIAQTSEFASDEEQRVYLNHIDFVHQLQNLFFVFTGGKELTIKV